MVDSRLKRLYFIDGGTSLLLLVCLVIFIDSVGYGVVVPVLPLYAQKLGVSDFANGFLFATYAIALLAGAIPAGLLSDRWGRKPFILFGMFAMTGAFIFYALAGSYRVLVVARVLDGLTAAATWSAGLALLGDRLEESEMGLKMGYAIGAMAVGGIAGPLLGGILYDAAGYRAPFYAIAGACFVGGAISIFLKEDRAARRKVTKTVAEMLGPVLKNKTIGLACLITVVTTMGIGLLEPTLPIYLKKNFSMSSTGIGVIFGVTMLCYAVTSPIAGRVSDAVGRKKPVVVGLIATAIIIPFLAVFHNVPVLYVLMGISGVTLAVFETPSLPMITDSLPRDEAGGNLYGTAFGLTNLFWSLGYALGPLIGGAIMGWLGLLAALCLYSGLLVILTFLVIRWLE